MPKVHSMHLGPNISGVELAFMSMWWHGYSQKSLAIILFGVLV